jgi:hypothetical protein
MDERLVDPQSEDEEDDQRPRVHDPSHQPVRTQSQQHRHAQLDNGHGAHGQRQDEHRQAGVHRPEVVERPAEAVEPLAGVVVGPDHGDALQVLDDAPGGVGLGVLAADGEPVEGPVGPQVERHGQDHTDQGRRRQPEVDRRQHARHAQRTSEGAHQRRERSVSERLDHHHVLREGGEGVALVAPGVKPQRQPPQPVERAQPHRGAHVERRRPRQAVRPVVGQHLPGEADGEDHAHAHDVVARQLAAAHQVRDHHHLRHSDRHEHGPHHPPGHPLGQRLPLRARQPPDARRRVGPPRAVRQPSGDGVAVPGAHRTTSDIATATGTCSPASVVDSAARKSDHSRA